MALRYKTLRKHKFLFHVYRDLLLEPILQFLYDHNFTRRYIYEDLVPIRPGKYFGKFESLADYWEFGEIPYELIRPAIRVTCDLFWKAVLTKAQQRFIYAFDWACCGKLLSSDPHFLSFRSRGWANTAYYYLSVYPLGFYKFRRVRYLDANKHAVNTFATAITAIAEGSDYTPELKSEITKLFTGFIWSKKSMHKAARAVIKDFNKMQLENSRMMEELKNADDSSR